MKFVKSALLAFAVIAAIAGSPARAVSFADATSVGTDTAAKTACTTIDGVDFSNTQWFATWADVPAHTKPSKTIASGSGQTCCTAAHQFNPATNSCQLTPTPCAAMPPVAVAPACSFSLPMTPSGSTATVGFVGGGWTGTLSATCANPGNDISVWGPSTATCQSSCGAGTAWNQSANSCLSVCTAPQTWNASTSSCACPVGQQPDPLTGACAPIAPVLFDCPPVLKPWGGSGPITPLADANPAALTPDQHQWCYYYGRGGDDGGDPWAAAFDRVVGKPVAYYPTYLEKVKSTNPPTAYGHTDFYGDFVIDGYYPSPPNLWFDVTSFKGVTPVYGTGQISDGGSKCAPPRPAGAASNDLSGYYQAWYPSDCEGNGDSGLSLYGPTQYPGSAACIYTLDPSNPIRSVLGYTQIKIGGSGTMEGTQYQNPQSMLIYKIAPAFAFPATNQGCFPGQDTLRVIDPYAPPPPDQGSKGQ